jgi:hypothetical protein
MGGSGLSGGVAEPATKVLLNLNGTRYSATSGSFDIAGERYRGVRELSWKSEAPKIEKYGTGRKAFGYVRGQCKASASMTIVKAQGDRLISVLSKLARAQQGSSAASYMDAEFDINARFKESNLGLSSAEVRGASIANMEEALSTDGLVYKVDLFVFKSLRRIVNGEVINDMPDDDDDLVPVGA